jgi:hypothetical protein
VVAFFVPFSLYDRFVLGEHSLGVNEPPYVTPYYIGRMALACLLSAALVYGAYHLRDKGAEIAHRKLSARQMLLVYFLVALGFGFTALFLASPTLFYEFSLEDGPVEWPSALLLLAASALFIYAFVRIRRGPHDNMAHRLAIVLVPLAAVFFFVSGMEEISWMQRIFHIQTPAMFDGNQQGEMNFHNMHSIMIGNTYTLLVFGGLIVVPFLVETAPKNRLFDFFADFLPSRFVLAVSATLAGFHYNDWNFFMTPIVVLVTLFILACYVKAAWDRSDRREMMIFGSLMALLVIAQPLFLAFGDRMIRMWDVGEYMELLMITGMFVYSWQTTRRLVARYGTPRQVANVVQGAEQALPAAQAYGSRKVS